MVFCGELTKKHIHKFKPKCLLIWQNCLTYLDKYQLHLPSGTSTKFFRISQDQVQVISKSSIICFKYQVQVLYLTSTLPELSVLITHIAPTRMVKLVFTFWTTLDIVIHVL